MALTPEQEALNFNPELQDVSRQRKLADLLMAQGMQQPQGQMISGRYVAPSWTQQLNPMANVLASQAVSGRADTQQTKLAEALKAKKVSEIEKYASLENDKGAQLRYGLAATDNPILQNLVQERLKGTKLGKGDILTKETLSGQISQLEGNPDIPDVIQYAISVGGLPPNPSTWNNQQRAYAKQLIESKANAGAGRNITYVGNKSIAEQVGPMMKELQGNVQAAVKTEDFANNIIKAIDTNKLYAGTGANVRLGVAQIADTVGIGGKDLQTKISNTRQTMQGLAQLTLQGRQQMRGQGAITENESKLAERAISGDITFTPTEIKQLANAAKRSADYTYKNYESKLDEMAKSEDTRGLVPYYQVPRMTPQVDSGLPSQSAIDAEIARRTRK